MAVVLIPLPSRDFDPTEVAVPWLELTRRGHTVHFATPDGVQAVADPRMVHGDGLGPWKAVLRADKQGRAAHSAMLDDARFCKPLRYETAAASPFDGLILPGGHAPGMRPYLESPVLQSLVASAFACEMPVGAICHGVLLAARSKASSGRSVLFGRRTTGLTKRLELLGWALTTLWLGNYYRTYPETVQSEVTAVLSDPGDFLVGPTPLLRDSPQHLDRGFVVRDANYLSARWPGDAHRFAVAFRDLLEQHVAAGTAQRVT